MDMLCIKIRVTGFRNIKINSHVICIDKDKKLFQVLDMLKEKFNIEIDQDEIMAMCNDKQIYLDEYIPNDCDIITLFPLALGG